VELAEGRGMAKEGGNKRNRPNGTVGTEMREETCNHRNNEKSASKPSLSLLDQATIMYEI